MGAYHLALYYSVLCSVSKNANCHKMLCICYLKPGKARPLFHFYSFEHIYPALKMHYFHTLILTVNQEIRIRPHKRRFTVH